VLIFEKVDTENSIIRVLIHLHLERIIVGIRTVNCAIFGNDCADLVAVASLLRSLSAHARLKAEPDLSCSLLKRGYHMECESLSCPENAACWRYSLGDSPANLQNDRLNWDRDWKPTS